MTTAIIQTEATPKRGPGAPKGNRNAFRHGLRGSGLPAGCGHVHRATNQFRQNLENEVLALRGEITLQDAASINTAFRWERHAQLCQRWLLKECESMSASDRLAYSRDVARAAEARDRAIAALRLPTRENVDMWEGITLDSDVKVPEGMPDSPGTESGSEINSKQDTTGECSDTSENSHGDEAKQAEKAPIESPQNSA